MPLLWISLCFMAGIVAGSYLHGSAPAWAVLGFGLIVACMLLNRLALRFPRLSTIGWVARADRNLRVAPMLLLAFAALGAAWFELAHPDIERGHIAGLNDRGTYRITGVVAAPPDRRDGSTLLRLSAALAAPLDSQGGVGIAEPAHGLIQVMIAGQTSWQYGDRLRLDGKPETPPEDDDFSYRDYLARQGIYTYLTYPINVRQVESSAGSPLLAAIYRLRDWAYREVYHLYPAPEAPLLAGILLGMDNDLPDSLASAFQATGTAHVIAISGFNIAILAELFSKLFGKVFSRWWATVMAVLAIAGYTLMVGATPSVVRAAVMGTLALVAAQIGRRTTGANALALTGALMCLPNPYLPWDASFQLSFGATLGLILLGDPIQDGFNGWLKRRLGEALAQKIAGPVGEYFLLTLAAQIMTLPVILYHFQRLSVSALISNPLILPPQPLVMVLSGLAVLVGLVSDPLAHALAWLAWPLTAYTIRMVEALAAIPGGVLVIGDFGLTSAVLTYAAIFALTWSKRFPEWVRRAITPAVGLVTLGLIAAMTWRAAASAPDGKLHLVVFEAGGNPAVLVFAPEGQTMLINGGPSGRLINDTLGRWLSPFDRQLDGVLINSQQAGQLTGLSGLLDRDPPGAVWWACVPGSSRSAEKFSERLRGLEIPTGRLLEGETLALGESTQIEILAAGEMGSALLISSGNFRALIPGGIPPGRLDLDDLTNLSALLLEPRDLETTPVGEWESFAPQMVLTSGAGAEGGEHGFSLIPQGWYAITTDGQQMWVERH